MSSEIETQEKSKDTQYNITHSQDKNRNNKTISHSLSIRQCPCPICDHKSP